MNTQKSAFWEKKYIEDNIGWDIGHISTPIKEYIDQLQNKNIRILIPGAGNSYEAEYLHNLGFKNVTVIDWAQSALDNIKQRVPGFSSKNLLDCDFFEHQASYDLIIEQTFFCAINVDLRTKYVSKMNSLLTKDGKLIGLLFNVPLNTDHPPFGGNLSEYIPLFENSFNILTMEKATNSIQPRKDKELFMILEKK